MRLRMILSALAFAGLFSAQQAQAHGGSMACYTDSIPFTLTDFNATLTFPQFDPNDAFGNGTNLAAVLTKVSLNLQAQLLGNVALSNLNELPISVSGSLAPSVVIQRPDLSPLLSVMLNAPFGPVPLNGMGTFNVGPLTAAQSTASMLTLGPDLALFEGPGTLTLPVVGTATLFAESGGGNVNLNATTSVAAAAAVCYHFSIVPEPGTFALLLFGAAGLLRRRQGRHSNSR